MQLSPHFDAEEFESRGDPVWNIGRLRRLAQNLEVIRHQFGGAEVDVISGCRSKKHNTDVGGADKSLHLDCEAADIKVEGEAPTIVFATILELIRQGRIDPGGVGLYRSWVHYDIRGGSRSNPVTWRGKAMKDAELPAGINLAPGPTVDQIAAGMSPDQSVIPRGQAFDAGTQGALKLQNLLYAGGAAIVVGAALWFFGRDR